MSQCHNLKVFIYCSKVPCLHPHQPCTITFWALSRSVSEGNPHVYFNLTCISQVEVSKTCKGPKLCWAQSKQIPQMSKHCLCYHRQRRQNSSCFGSSSLFILTKANAHTLALQCSVSWLVAMGVWKANFFQLREGCSCSLLLSLCPALAESLQSWKLQHQPHHRVKRAAPLACHKVL